MSARGFFALVITLMSPSIVRAQSAPCDEHGIATVITCIPHDVARIAGRDSLIALGAGAAAAAASAPFDDRVLESLHTDHPGNAYDIGNHVGEAGTQFGLAAGVYVLGRAAGSSEIASTGVMMLRAQVVNGIFTRGLKVIPRARPFRDEGKVGQGSFPSGHASGSFATATVLARRYGWKAGVPAYAIATFVSITRLQNAHFLSDVTFGAALGVASGLTVPIR